MNRFDENFEKLKEETVKDAEPRIPHVESPLRDTAIAEWREVIHDAFPELILAAEACASVICQLLIEDIHNPFGLVLVDAPSSGKTITLNFFTGLENIVYSTDKFSPASFVSHASNVRAEKLKDVDLLPRIRHRTMVVRELASIFSDREEDLSKNIGILTRVFDGEGLEMDSGVHGKRGYQGDYCFMFLAASTPIAPRVWKCMGNFGSRLFFLDIGSRSKSEDELVGQLQGEDWKVKEQGCRKITHEFIKTLFSEYQNGIVWDKKRDDLGCLKQISRCAMLLAHLRAPINVWKDAGKDDSFDHSVPNIEKPDRINQLLYNLARGHAVIHERTYITEEDMNLILQVTFASAPSNRVKTFKALLEKNGELKTGETMKALNCSRPTALKEQEALRVLGIVTSSDQGDEVQDLERHIKLKPEFHWALKEEYREHFGIPIPRTECQIPFTPRSIKEI